MFCYLCDYFSLDHDVILPIFRHLVLILESYSLRTNNKNLVHHFTNLERLHFYAAEV
jgi:hypothetical protein